MEFNTLGLNDYLLQAIEKQKFLQPTEIQEKTIPLGLEGKDVTGESATGSGKTLAFGTVLLQRLRPGNGLQGLVLTPTREIAEQVTTVLAKLSRKHNVISVYGGVSFNNQVEQLKTADVVIATPGRMLDHIQQRTIDLSHIAILVLDEADRMLDMGFIQDVESIIKACPKERQILLFSATLAPDIKRLASKHMRAPIHVRVDNRVDPKKLNQSYYDVARQRKFSLLMHLLKQEDSRQVMVFCNTKRMADQVAYNLSKNRILAKVIHGGLTQARRLAVIRSFHKGETEVLVCTDVAARGLDIPFVSHVYNYDIPSNATDYVHRIGRTARAGRKGKVINLVCEYDHEGFGAVMDDRTLNITHKETPRIEIVRLHQRNAKRGGRKPSSRPRQGGRGRRRR